jgi:hypothetical protein
MVRLVAKGWDVYRQPLPPLHIMFIDFRYHFGEKKHTQKMDFLNAKINLRTEVR